MSVRKRLNPNERKKEILSAGMKVFKEKGFQKATMEEIISHTTLSKGGFYYYYKDTVDILHDIMLEGMFYRNNIIKSCINKSETDNKNFIAKQIVEKLLDDNPYTSIYVEFLFAKKNNPKLENLFKTLCSENKKSFLEVFGDDNKDLFEGNSLTFLTNFINSFILGADILSARENFRKNKPLLVNLVEFMINRLERI